MPATITVACPECDKQFKAPDTVAGKKIRCKECETVFVARELADEVEEVEEVEVVKPRKKPAVKKPEPKKVETKKAEEKKPDEKKPVADDDDSKAYDLGGFDESHRCPFCAAEMLSEDAVVCVECGYNTETREQAKTRKLVEHTGMEHFLWLLPGILWALLSVLIIVWFIIHWGPLHDWLGGDKAEQNHEWQMFLTHLSMRLWFTVGLCFLLATATWKWIDRLILNNTPPEIEKR